jgi:tetratricopeptide (TPR) repeat protein
LPFAVLGHCVLFLLGCAETRPHLSAQSFPRLIRPPETLALSSALLPIEPWPEAALDAAGRLELVRSLRTTDDLLAGSESASLVRARAMVPAGYEAQGEALLRTLGEFSLDRRVSGQARVDLGETLLRRGENEQAAHTFARFLEAQEDCPSRGEPEIREATRETWRARFWYGAALARAGERAQAAQVLSAAADEAAPGHPARVLGYRWAGWLEAGQGNLPAARRLWRNAISAGARSAVRDSINLSVAETWFAEAEWDSVLAVLARGHDTRSGGARWDFLRGRAYLELGKIDSAATALDRVLEHRPAAPTPWRDEVHAILAWMALKSGKPEEAVAHYGRISGERVEDVPVTRYGTALAWIHEGAFEEAERVLAPAPPIPPEDPIYYHWAYALAYSRFHLRMYGQSIESLETFRGRVLADSVGQASFSLRGDCYFRLGRMEEAYAAYAKSAAMLAPVPELLHRRQSLAAIGSGRWGAAARLLGDLILRYPATEHAAEYNFWRAEAFYRLGRLSEAGRHYRQAERFGADRARCAYALGWCEYEEGRYQKALEHFNRAHRHCGDCSFASDLALRAGNCLFNLGRLEAAAEAFAEAEDLAHAAGAPELGREASFQLAWAELRLGEFAAAQERFERIRRAEGRSELGARALYWEGQSLFRQESYDEASRRFERLQKHPGASDTLRARARLAIGDALFNMGEMAEAIGWYRRVLETPGGSDALALTAGESLFECQQRGGEWLQAQRTQEALEARFRSAKGHAERRLQLADGFFRGRHFADALSSYGSFLERVPPTDPRFVEARFQMARCREELGELEEAARAYRSLGEIQGFRRRSEALLRAGTLFLKTGEESRALSALEGRLGLDLEPAQAAVTRAYLAQAYGKLGQGAAAQNEWEKVAHAGSGASDSLRAVANLQLGRTAFSNEQWQAAFDRFAAADSLGLPPHIFRARYWAGEAALQKGDTPAAIVWLEAFLAQGEREQLWEATARFRLAECYEIAGREAEARGEYERIAALGLKDGDLSEEARARLQTLGAGDGSVEDPESEIENRTVGAPENETEP